jgi:mannose-6-phosphate isomerase-like protein (cupin superfamily)
MDDTEAPEIERRTRLVQAISAAGLSIPELWPRYFALGGLRSESELRRYLDGALELSPSEVDVIAATVFEHTGAFVNDAHRGALLQPTDEAASSPLGPTDIEAAIWIDETGRASPSATSKDDWLARSLSLGHLVRLDRQPDSQWERHPGGDEVIHLLSGELVVSTGPVHAPETTTMSAGETTVIAANTWHRHVASEPSAVLFVTPLLGTEQRTG